MSPADGTHAQVTVTTEPAEETEGNPSLTGYFLHASREGPADGLRSALAECGVDELIPELFETEFEEATGPIARRRRGAPWVEWFHPSRRGLTQGAVR